MSKRDVYLVAVLGCVLIGVAVLTSLQRRAQVVTLQGTSKVEPQLSEAQRTLRDRLERLRWIAYAPTNWNPASSPPVIPTEDSMRADLKVLRAAGFDGLVTYGASFVSLPRLATEAGFSGMLLGVWDPRNKVELNQAKESSKTELVCGIIVGNEGLTFTRYNLSELRLAMEEMRRDTGKPVSTTEIFEKYAGIPEIIQLSDFLAVNAHPFFHGVRDPKLAVEWTVAAYRDLAKLSSKIVWLKEVGLPSGGEPGLSEKNQAEYYALLQKTEVRFCFFEFADQPWKSRPGSAENQWGLWSSKRLPKAVVRVIERRTKP